MNGSPAKLLTIAISLCAVASAQIIYPLQLNDTLTDDGEIGQYQFSPDGEQVVYIAEQDTATVSELFSVPVAGGMPIKLNGALAPGGDVHSFEISPDGGRVVYRAEQDDARSAIELFSVPIGGDATPIKLNDALPSSASVSKFEISPDGTSVVYIADQDTAGVDELYSVSITGSPRGSSKLNGPFTAGGGLPTFTLDPFTISPDGSRVVYLADQDTAGVDELYSVAIGGGTAVRLNGPLTSSGYVGSFLISPDAGIVLYLARLDIASPWELFSVPISGGIATKLNKSIPAGGSGVSDFDISPDGISVVYIADGTSANQNELYRVGMSGNQSTLLNGSLTAGGDVDWFAISSDSDRVVYLADQETLLIGEIYSVPISGGGAVKLNGVLAPKKDLLGFRLSRDGKHMVYRDGRSDLYSVAIRGGSPLKLTPDGSVWFDFQISPDSRSVVYQAWLGNSGKRELYSVQLSGGATIKLSGDLGALDALRSFKISPDGRRVVYRNSVIASDSTVYRDALSSTLAQAIWLGSGGDWGNAVNWDTEAVPSPVVQAVINSPAVVRMDGSPAPREVDSLWLGGDAAGASVLELRDDALLHASSGITLAAGGTILGDGVVSVGLLELVIPPAAAIGVAKGEQLRVMSGATINFGQVEATGVATDPSRLEFSGLFLNAPDTGSIIAHDATLRFRSGLINESSLSFTGGFNDVFGVIENSAAGRIIVSGGAQAVFYDDILNSGVIRASASGALQSLVAFFGAFTGNGVSGGGHVFIEGDARPGFSPGTMSFGGDVSYGPLASLEIEIGGTEPGVGHDQLTVAGQLELDGRLEVTLLAPFVPTAGDVFDLLDAGSVLGAFRNVALPGLPQGLFWHAAEVDSSGELRVGLTPPTYAEFAALHGLTTPPEGDEEGDGLPNLLEYLTARDPNARDFDGALLNYERVGDDDRLTVDLASPSGNDVVLVLETSTNLEDSGPGGWSALETRTGNAPWTGTVTGVDIVPAGDGREKVIITDTTTGNQRRFYRLKASLVP